GATTATPVEVGSRGTDHAAASRRPEVPGRAQERDRHARLQRGLELVTEFLEGDLDPHAELRFTNHVRGCLGCSRYLEQVQQTIELLRDLPEPEHLPASTRTALLASFRDSVAD
ncbi:hypothetical protein, partial [Aeromicrobium sp.]|uniref:hypothetical protein n=1 Tax=Aeromicrobium sp. TaxID=1871063 RepID=UPI003D6BE031